MNKVCRTFLFYVCTMFIWISIVEGEIINISDYKYPIRIKGNLKAQSPNHYQIAIFATNDLHGFVTSEKKVDNDAPIKSEWEVGGMELLTSYIKILKKEWGNRFLWLDAGDEFQGGYESKLTKGKIMSDILNKVGLSAGTFGNHEFDDGEDLLREHVKQANFPYITGNVFKQGDGTFFGQQPTKVFTVGEIKIGVIGITTQETAKFLKKEMKDDFEFRNYVETVEKYIDQLRKKDKVDAVILLAHEGNQCKNKNNKSEILKLQLWNKENSIDTKIQCLAKGTIIDLITELTERKKKVDLVIAGHTHEISHFFYKGIPVVSSINNGKYANSFRYISKNQKRIFF